MASTHLRFRRAKRNALLDDRMPHGGWPGASDRRSDRAVLDTGRPIWTGATSFRVVNVPGEVYPADPSRGVSCSVLDRRDFAPIGRKRYNRTTGHEVPCGNGVKG